MIKKKITSLAELESGTSGRIKELQGGRTFSRRLESMGIRTGKRAVKISGMPLRGPVVVQVEGTRVALGRRMAAKVMVELS